MHIQYNECIYTHILIINVDIGASSGIGRATAIHFARLGAKLSLTGRSLEQLQASADLCYENGCEKDVSVILSM